MLKMFVQPLQQHLNIAPSSAHISTGGWAGKTNPSCQFLFAATSNPVQVEEYAVALGLIWRQDSVAVTHFDADGKNLAIRITRKDGRPFTSSQIARRYAAVWEADATAGTAAAPNFSSPAVGFTEHNGAVLFINAGELPDKEWERQLFILLEAAWSGDYDFDRVRVSFTLIDGGAHGELYRQRLREAGRSDLLQWIDSDALPSAQNFLQAIHWKTGKAARR
jgi:hypothetical protein